MKQVLQNYRTGELLLEDVPAPQIPARGVLVKNHFSVISAGTERMKLEQAEMSLLQKARARPDQVKKVLESVRTKGVMETMAKVRDRLDSLTPLGYSSAGVVVGAGVAAGEFQVGDRVACAGAGYANHAEFVSVPRNLTVSIPDPVPLEHAALATLGAISLQGLRQANVAVGEAVAVIGLGLLGQLTVQLLRAAGCRVLAIDLNQDRLEVALAGGAERAVARSEVDQHALRGFTQGRGVDAVLVTAGTPSSDPIDLAASISRDRGRVVAVGAVGVDIPNTVKSVFYERELDLRVSRSYGAGRYDPVYEEEGVDYPIGYVRWTEKRNMEAFLDLLGQGRLSPELLISHRFAFAKAPEAFHMLSQGDVAEVFGILLEYAVEAPLPAKRSTAISTRKEKPRETIGVGVIGAGNHARTHIIPPLRDHPHVQLRGVATASGSSAQDAARKYGFSYAAASSLQLLEDDGIDCVVIATRHDSHAGLVIDALAQDRDVFVEKPLAMTLEELRRVVRAQGASQGRLMVGFNRRFAPQAVRVRDFFSARNEPLMMLYRVNAGFQSSDNWYQSADQGGGRIVGECGHFIDLMAFLAGAAPSRVSARAIPDASIPYPDNASITMDFADGSVGTLVYTSTGSPSMAKERLEVFAQGRSAVLDDFRTVALHGPRSSKRSGNRFTQDKGNKAQMAAFISGSRGRIPWPVSFEEQACTTLATILALRSLREGGSFPLDVAAMTGAED